MAYPSTISSFSNPIPTDRLNSPSHSSVETAQNTGLTELQTYIGVITGANASAIGTLIYDVKALGSDGGGHVQTAIKGGTGQTTYTKGDILVAQSSSTLSRLTVGEDNQILSSNSSVASGLNWVATSTNKVNVSASILGRFSIIGESSLMTAVAIPGSVLGLNNAVRTTVYVNKWDANQNTSSVIARAIYGNNIVASVVFGTNITVTENVGGTFIYTLMGNAGVSAQRGILEVKMGNQQYINNAIPASSVIAIFQYSTGTASVNSSAPQTLGMTIQGPSGDGFTVGGTIVE